MLASLGLALVAALGGGTPALRNPGLGQEGFEAVAKAAVSSVKPGDTTTLWFGVKNTDSVPRTLCLTSIRFQLELEAGEIVLGGGLTGNAGPCGSVSDLHLVLPGETYFLLTQVPIPLEARGTLGIFLVGEGHHRPAEPGDRLGPEFKVASWLEVELGKDH